MADYFSQLHKQAIKTQQSTFNSITGKYAPSTQKVTLSESQKNLAAINYFLKAGLDYKGQSQCCYEKKGGGLQVNGSIDPGRILGVFSTELSLSAGLTRSKEILLIAQRGPSKLNDLLIPSPIMINSLVGASWEGSAKAGVEITVGVKYSVGINEGSKIEKSWVKEEDDPNEPKIKLENMGLAFEAEAKAGFSAEAGYQYQHFYAEDVCPIPFDNQIEAKKTLGKLFTEGSYKAILKKDACELINGNRFFNKTVSYDGFWGHITTKEIISILSKGCQHRTMGSATKNKARSLIDSLLCWADADKKPSIPTSLRISSHKGDAKAGLIAIASVKVNAYIVGVEASASAEALAISGVCKSASVRYQTVYYAPHELYEKAHVIMTQDSKIVYKQIVFTPLSVTAGASFNAPFYSKGAEKEKPLLEHEILNRMTYTTTTVFWTSSAKLLNESLQKRKMSQTFSSLGYKGTGISFGGSFELEDLISFYRCYDGVKKEFLDKEVEVYFYSIAKSLSVESEDLVKFFMELKKNNEYGLLNDLAEANGVKTVLLEASFSVTVDRVDVISTVNGKNELIELAPDTAKKIFEAGKSSRKLEAIRMRYRIQDTHNGDSDFTLGFKVLGNGLGISLKKVNQAGSEGIVDLATVWMNGLSNAFSNSTNYEQAVPAVTLFCQ
ncbi:hypothetical protein [Methylobacter sp. S3L5C]|uniref:hypothetical protein n=1 Tax=Methylobacter sp. S3L5C TaxID=2839024 RepID=UPI001FAB3E8F|nr:hypothetical protein [Methylobacter sp. S3L5C]UOA10477.1 hypothetical protein KKZ03_09720 [Methylobacter sp. S3L5C]